MVRLLTTNICNAYLTSTFLSLAGGFEDPRLLLPGWIGIATVRPSVSSPAHATQMDGARRSTTLTATDHRAADTHRVVPHHAPEDQHPQGNLNVDQCFLDSQLLQHGDFVGTHAPVHARISPNADCSKGAARMGRGIACCCSGESSGEGEHRAARWLVGQPWIAVFVRP